MLEKLYLQLSSETQYTLPPILMDILLYSLVFSGLDLFIYFLIESILIRWSCDTLPGTKSEVLKESHCPLPKQDTHCCMDLHFYLGCALLLRSESAGQSLEECSSVINFTFCLFFG